jgi:Acetyltransferase (GNAT) domain
VTGYLHHTYSEALAAFGTPRQLHGCGGSVLLRPVPGADVEDAMGCYPLFVCRDWGSVREDVDGLAGEAVALSLVTDPLGNYTPSELRAVFPDFCHPYKDHFVIDLHAHDATMVSTHHRRNLRCALRDVEVEHSLDPSVHAMEWVALYEHLIARHRIRGIPAFSPDSLVRQLRVPGLTMIRGVHQGVTAGITLWYRHGEAAYYHLGAYSEAGYAVRASFALFHYAIDHFRGRVRWLNLGAGAGAKSDPADGLTRFKRGWATGVRTAWLCGRILDQERYTALTAARGVGHTDYFPAYRAGEFA